jgi:hypothetical protein
MSFDKNNTIRVLRSKLIPVGRYLSLNNYRTLHLNHNSNPLFSHSFTIIP